MKLVDGYALIFPQEKKYFEYLDDYGFFHQSLHKYD